MSFSIVGLLEYCKWWNSCDCYWFELQIFKEIVVLPLSYLQSDLLKRFPALPVRRRWGLLQNNDDWFTVSNWSPLQVYITVYQHRTPFLLEAQNSHEPTVGEKNETLNEVSIALKPFPSVSLQQCMHVCMNFAALISFFLGVTFTIDYKLHLFILFQCISVRHVDLWIIEDRNYTLVSPLEHWFDPITHCQTFPF